MGFVADLPDRVILDDVQRVPEVLAALKMEVDRRRAPGRFALTGSTNVLLIPNLSDSLAGRLQIVRLHPLAQCELAVGSRSDFNSHLPFGFLDDLLGGRFKTRRTRRLGKGLLERIVAGGFPAALRRPSGRRRSNLYRDYIATLVQRDMQDRARIRVLEALPRFPSAASSQTARLFNLADLSSPLQRGRPTIGAHTAILERLILIERLPHWHSNRLSRLVKTPRLHVGDTGLAAALLGADTAALSTDRELLGQLLETFVFQELRRQASWHDARATFFHFRDKDGAKVGVVIERGVRALAAVEVKAAATVRPAAFRGLRKLANAVGERFAGGVVLYDGEVGVRFGERSYAAPIRQLWATK